LPDLGSIPLLQSVPDFIFGAALAALGMQDSGLAEGGARDLMPLRGRYEVQQSVLGPHSPLERRGTKHSQRAEAKEAGHSDDVNLAGRTLWYAFSVYVDPASALPAAADTQGRAAKLSLAQFHQRDAAGRSDRPALMFYLQPNGDLIAQFEKAVGKRAYVLAHGGPEGRGAMGRWLDIVVSAHWDETAGETRFWIRQGDEAEYRLVAQDRGANTSTGQLYFKYGLYRSFLERDPDFARAHARAFYDAVRRGDSFEAVRRPTKGPAGRKLAQSR